jgi:hypothetical protein
MTQMQLSEMQRPQMHHSFPFLVNYSSIYEPPNDTSIFTFNLASPIVLESTNYEIALTNLETYYSFPSITSGKKSILNILIKQFGM